MPWQEAPSIEDSRTYDTSPRSVVVLWRAVESASRRAEKQRRALARAQPDATSLVVQGVLRVCKEMNVECTVSE